MGTEVYANGREISAKASGNKSIAAMPGPCLSPPSPPAGPIPIPYPNFSKAADLTGGSKNVKIKNKEVGLKNVSTYKSSKGNEAATRNFGMGVITHTIQGKTKFAAWSFDVKVEGKNVTRFMDLTTHNHMNQGDAVTSSIGKPGVGIAPDPECVALSIKNEQEREKLKNKTTDKTLVGPNGNGKGTTVSSCNFTPSSGGASWTKRLRKSFRTVLQQAETWITVKRGKAIYAPKQITPMRSQLLKNPVMERQDYSMICLKMVERGLER